VISTTPKVLFALCVPFHLLAQDVGTVQGNVTASDGGPLALAQISVIGTKVATRSDSLGAFQFVRVAAGLRVIQVARMGYQTILMPIHVQAAETAHVRVVLAMAGVALEPIEVKAAPAPFSPAMRGFEERRARASGHFFRREEIVRMQPRLFTDVLRRVPGVQLIPSRGPFETGEAVRMSRTIGVMGASSCPVLYYINGSPFPVTGDIPIDHYIVPEDVAAIEIYSGMSQIPAQFNSSSHNARCGVIVIWTLSAVDTTQTH
jgi:hypothetical protein